jgi:hypothetical protein
MTPSRLPHYIPLAFVALISGLRWRHLLQTKEAWSSANELDRWVLDYSTTLLKTTYLLRRGLRDLQLLCHPLAGGVVRLPWRRSQTSLQASRRILHEGYMRQARMAKPRQQLEAALQRLLVVVLVGRVFYDDGVISFADFPPLLGLGLSSCRMDLPGPTTSVGTRTDYSVGPWDYPACATRLGSCTCPALYGRLLDVLD